MFLSQSANTDTPNLNRPPGAGGGITKLALVPLSRARNIFFKKMAEADCSTEWKIGNGLPRGPRLR